MIKATSKDPETGKVGIVFLGLSEENCKRLVAGQPIPVRLSELDASLGDLSIIIFGGTDEASMQAELKSAHTTWKEGGTTRITEHDAPDDVMNQP